MYGIISIILAVLAVFILWGLLTKVFSIIFKVAVFLLVLIIVIGLLVYVDLNQNDLIGTTEIVFANEEEILNGYFLINGSVSDPIDVNLDYDMIKNSDFKDFGDIGDSNVVILVIGNYTEPNPLTGKFQSYFDIIKIFKHEEIYFYPKTHSLRIIEGLN